MPPGPPPAAATPPVVPPTPQPTPQPTPYDYSAPAPTYGAPGAYGASTPVGAGTGNPPGRDKTNLAWVCCAVAFVTCGLGAIAGIYFGTEAKKAGDPMAQTAIIVSAVVTGLFALGWLGVLASFA